MLPCPLWVAVEEEAPMGVVSLDQITTPAFEQRYGVPAINIFNDLTLEGVLAGAVEARSPMIVQTSVKTCLLYTSDAADE